MRSEPEFESMPHSMKQSIPQGDLSMMSLRPAIPALALILSQGVLTAQQEIGFPEEFALAADRTKALEQLLPGTDDYYFYHCLHFQTTEQFDRVESLIDPWKKAHRSSERRDQIVLRQALLLFERQPEKSLDTLKKKLGIDYSAAFPSARESGAYPSVLDPSMISRDSLALSPIGANQLEPFQPSAYEWLLSQNIRSPLRHEILKAIDIPSIPQLVDHILQDLKDSKTNFGSLPIHSKLTFAQYEECFKKDPSLAKNEAFVTQYLNRMRLIAGDEPPGKNRLPFRASVLKSIWGKAEGLSASFNSLKIHVLYHLLDTQRRLGTYDQDLFHAYAKLPRTQPYVLRSRLSSIPAGNLADLSRDFNLVTALPQVRNDEPLIQDFLHRFFVEARNYDRFSNEFEQSYLRREFATAKILSGLGDPQEWISYLGPEAYEALQKRVDVEFAISNPTTFSRKELIALDIFVKNVEALIVKVYEINTEAYYQENDQELNGTVDLDGLVANHESVLKFDRPPLHRFAHRVELPSINKPGVYVVDLIGSGKNSRAVLRIGSLDVVERTSIAGHIFHVFDEEGRPVTDANLWISGHQFYPDEEGAFTVPFTSASSEETILITSQSLTCRRRFQHLEEAYDLRGDFFLDYEMLRANGEAVALMRLDLRVHGKPAPIELLKDIQVILIAQTQHGTSSVIDLDDLEILDGQETIIRFPVPEHLASLTLSVQGEIEKVTNGKKVPLSDQTALAINTTDSTGLTENAYLSQDSQGFRVEILGRNGEPVPHRVLVFEFNHRHFRRGKSVVLQTDSKGSIRLGSLEDIQSLSIRDANGGMLGNSWAIRPPSLLAVPAINTSEGTSIRLPLPWNSPKPDSVSLLSVARGQFVADVSAQVVWSDKQMSVQGLPLGDYQLHVPGQRLTEISVSRGNPVGDSLVAPHLIREQSKSLPIAIKSMLLVGKDLTVSLDQHTSASRVHVFATDFQPTHSPYSTLGPDWERLSHHSRTLLENRYVAARDLGDEYRYIIDRQYATKFPGNMLSSPSLLLNPWAVQDTNTTEETLEAGSELFDDAIGLGGGAGGRYGGRAGQSRSAQTPSLDFLGEGSLLFPNLFPNEDGVVQLSLPNLGSRQHIHVLAIDNTSAAYDSTFAKDEERKTRDRRLSASIKSDGKTIRQDRIDVAQAGDSFLIENLAQSELETIRTLSDVFSFYQSTSKDSRLGEFRFLLEWNTFEEARKQELYTKYASHELHLFLYKKDRDFFGRVVHPFLANKKEKTFIDRWLLEDDLSEFMTPINFSQLNALEKVLLSGSPGGNSLAIQREMGEWTLAHPVSENHRRHLFETVLGIKALGLKADSRGLNEELKSLRALGYTVDKAAPPKEEAELEEMDEDSVEAQELNSRARKYKQGARAEGLAVGRGGRDLLRRQNTQAFYNPLESTQEWAESHYYRVRRFASDANLIPQNDFWADLALQDTARPFVSPNFIFATSNLNEMLMAMAVMDLPLRESPSPEFNRNGNALSLVPKAPMIVFLRTLATAKTLEENVEVLVSQQFFNPARRVKQENGKDVEIYVNTEFEVGSLYGSKIVVTNTSARSRELQILSQIPQGSIPCQGSKEFYAESLVLSPYSTQTREYYFYFPEEGQFPHFPTHIVEEETVVGKGLDRRFAAVKELTEVDKLSWRYIAEFGSPMEILNYLADNNLYQVSLATLKPRLKDRPLFQQVTNLLRERLVFNADIWSYSLGHSDPLTVSEYLPFRSDLISQCGAYLDSPLLKIVPEEILTYEHLEYRPLIAARTHALAGKNPILNDRLRYQYGALMDVLTYKRRLDDPDRLAVTYYLLLQNRVEDAFEMFAQVSPERLSTRIQYDYMSAYLAFFREDLELAGSIAGTYSNYPVDHWRKPFQEIQSHLDEIYGRMPEVIAGQDRNSVTEVNVPKSFDFFVEADRVQMAFEGLKKARANYYLMDVELLFSRNPFITKESGRASFIRPNESTELTLESSASKTSWPLPESLHNRNVLVEVVADGIRRSTPYYANSLTVHMIESAGQLRVSDPESGAPLPKVYVKVYARSASGEVRFYKDGYTDLRGRFDYTSVSTTALSDVDRFSILILSDERGAVVRETRPPKQ